MTTFQETNTYLAMRFGIFVLICLLVTGGGATLAQAPKSNAALSLLDKSHFVWKGFSFSASWLAVKKETGLVKVSDYQEDYMNRYCGEISDTKKSYQVTSDNYLEFAALISTTFFYG